MRFAEMKSGLVKPGHRIPRLPDRPKPRAFSAGTESQYYGRLTIVHLKDYIRHLIEKISGTPEERNRPWLIVQSSLARPTGVYREIILIPFTAALGGSTDVGVSIYVGMPAGSGLKQCSHVICDKIISVQRKHIRPPFGYLEPNDPAVERINQALRVALAVT
jgi:mRNA-degrading endonuclease toxin of MazEF toxin-antitoxin module